MKEKEFKNILNKYRKGTATSDEIQALEKFEDHFLEKNKDDIFVSELHKKQIRNDIYKKVRRNIHTTQTNWHRIVAGLIVLLGVGASFWFAFHRENNVNYIAVSTTADEIKTITLNDSSVITLNGNSTLEFPNRFSAEERHVKLDGEAYFKIHEDKQRPFTVYADSITTTVLGTEFNINMNEENISVALVEGSVDVKGLGVEKVLLPNEKINFDFQHKRVTTARFNPKDELLWLNNTLIFNNTDLKEITKILARKFNTEILLDSEELGTLSITGTFKDQSLTSILLAITKTADLQFKKTTENQIQIYKPK